jgi:hypothetical protein
MENMGKEKAALKVAAMHHNFLEKATHKYMELTGQVSEEFRQKIDEMCTECLQIHYQSVTEKEITCEDLKALDINCSYPSEITCDNSFRAAQKEMLKSLPGYRHPVAKRIIEKEIFFGDTNLDVGMVGYPRWIRHKSLLSLPEPLRDEIDDYAMEAEHDKYRLRRLRKENEELRELITTARKAYKKIDDNDDSHSRNTRVVQALGLSSGKKGNRQSIDHRGAYKKYVWLLRNRGKSREEALEYVQQEFGYQSVDSARNSLYKELRKVKDWWYAREGRDSVLYGYYVELGRLELEDWFQMKEKADLLENYWTGLILSKNQ